MQFPNRGWRKLAHRSGVIVLGAACAAFGIAALVRPRRLGERCGVSAQTMRVMGARDLGSALMLLAARDPRAGLIARVAFDANDAVLVARRRPAIALMAAAFGGISAGLAATAPREASPSDDR